MRSAVQTSQESKLLYLKILILFYLETGVALVDRTVIPIAKLTRQESESLHPAGVLKPPGRSRRDYQSSTKQRDFHRQPRQAMVSEADSCRIDVVVAFEFLELQAGMPWIALENPIGALGVPLNI